MKNIRCLLLALLASFAVAAEESAPAKADAAPDRAPVYQLFEAMKLPEQLNLTVDALLDTQIRQRPELEPARQILTDFFAAHLSYETLKEPLADLYLAEFTAEEIAAFRAFYETPAGRKLAENMSRLTLACSALVNELLDDRMPALDKELADFHAEREKARNDGAKADPAKADAAEAGQGSDASSR